MPKIKLERYMRMRKLKDGRAAYYLVLPVWAKDKKINGHKCPLDMSTPLGSDLGQADRQAKKYLALWDSWRSGDTIDTVMRGSVTWLFNEYRKLEAFKDLAPRTKIDYDKQLVRLRDFPLKTKKFGDLYAGDIKAKHADHLYANLKKINGPRQASYSMQVARLVWNKMQRLGNVKGNPFESMGIVMKAQNETRPWSRDQVEAFKATAREMGYQMWATAVTLCFELLQRPGDVIGRADEKGSVVDALRWSDYKAGGSFKITQNKTGKKLNIPMRDRDMDLFPELEAELAITPRMGAFIIMDDHHKSGIAQPMGYYKFARVFRKIKIAAGLPTDLKFMGCRHGGATELGDAGVEDVRAMTGHEGLAMTQTYNQASAEKAKQAARKRNILKAEIAEIQGEKIKN